MLSALLPRPDLDRSLTATGTKLAKNAFRETIDDIGSAVGGWFNKLTKRSKPPEVLLVGEVKLPAVPRNAVGTPTKTGKGQEYAIPSGTPELDPKVASVRIMDPKTTGAHRYPDGYAVGMDGLGQTVSPLNGHTIGPSHAYSHIPPR